MLISHRKKFIYTKTVKTASTSVECYFEQFCLPEGLWSQKHNRDVYVSDTGIIGYRGAKSTRPKNSKWHGHMSAYEIRKNISEDIWNNYFKFCVIRNPYDKAISAFYHYKKGQESPRKLPFRKAIKKKLISILYPKPQFSHISLEFEHYLKNVVLVVDRDKYTIDKEFCMDGVIRYENLIQDIEKICERLDVIFDPSLLPNFKIGSRDSNVSHAEIHTAKSVEIISDLYAYEIDKFGYEPPNLS